ncbi:hypothetical protein GHT06_009115 [Daphnia sinensis]|uniref:Uncharacterized protein n=1 Tax=Daphnia sinensis TaxID=1820382 RepID=A0AAD5LWF8_9CRUS|nr:hypothetical protein GHT06_009115 [Daphnia sinensis]
MYSEHLHILGNPSRFMQSDNPHIVVNPACRLTHSGHHQHRPIIAVKPFSSDAFRAPAAPAYRGKPASSDALRAPAPAYRRKPISSSDALRAPSYRKLVWSNAPELPAYFVSEDPITATDFSGSDEIRIYDNSNDFDSWPSVVRAYHPIPKDDSRVYAIYNANEEDFDDNRRGEYQTGYDRGGYYRPYGF